ncbi:hypothetical protein [Staphylococcus hyicus]|uniref:Uncharacterized protein n=1 Tax=Staphylococcus hyicus TaxID=1284 RepID=A0ACD5FNM6_STAHY|nr:hypothetical protein [Staphylococcus hyicus]AJC95796.1 hypothetical protein SHYC_05200 [Staphylococcus hyicus]MDP4462597.1 hypothetical protein [Staphylococcus hyicus]RTX65736.1 hypothetical protein EKQ60_11155 [Staphylococcus hyicus]SQE47294.1 Uncharacterised protein [Staphylococcus hyicus]
MNLSIYLKLRKCVKQGKIKLNSDYKHYDYMVDNKWIKPIIDDYKTEEDEMLVFFTPVYDDYVSITSEGKDCFFKARNKFLFWFIGIFITILSFITPVIKLFLP